VAILTESEPLKGDDRAVFVREKFDELERAVRK
jgi:hypothetical protein